MKILYEVPNPEEYIELRESVTKTAFSNSLFSVNHQNEKDS